MKVPLKTVAFVCVALAGALFALVYAAQLATAGAVKQRLETLLTERTGLTTTINGDLHWRYVWPTAITIVDISASDAAGTEYWIADALRLEANTLSVLTAPKNPASWHFKAFQITELRGERGASADADGDQYAIAEFWIRNISPDSAAPFSTTLRYQPRGATPVDLQLAGKLRLIADQRKLQFNPAVVSGSIANGECQADIALRPIATAQEQAGAKDDLPTVLNADLWRRSDWDLSCDLSELTLKGTTFENVSLTSSNLLGNSASELKLPIFFTGTAQLNLSIDASASNGTGSGVPNWVISPTVQNAASGPMLNWLQHNGIAPPHPWQGPVSIGGRIETSGNSRTAMVNNAKGELTLNSNNGTLDMTALKGDMAAPLKELGPLIGDAEEISNWPDTLEYLTLSGRWTPDSGIQRLDGKLDNLSLDAAARLQISPTNSADDTLSASGTFTFKTDQPPLSLAVPPILSDLPLPVACDGPPTLPRCALDAGAVQQLLADVMQGGGPEGLSRKLDEIIDQNVPEEYRRAARGLLEILGHSIDDEDAEELADFLDEDLDELVEDGG